MRHRSGVFTSVSRSDWKLLVPGSRTRGQGPPQALARLPSLFLSTLSRFLLHNSLYFCPGQQNEKQLHLDFEIRLISGNGILLSDKIILTYQEGEEVALYYHSSKLILHHVPRDTRGMLGLGNTEGLPVRSNRPRELLL